MDGYIEEFNGADMPVSGQTSIRELFRIAIAHETVEMVLRAATTRQLTGAACGRGRDFVRTGDFRVIA